MKFSRPNKFNAKAVTIDGIRFDSTAEGARYRELKLMEQAGEIRDLAIHKPYRLTVGDVFICVYESDFEYIDRRGARITEDCKGVKTDTYKIKAKLMLACHGIEILETSARTVRR